MLQKKESLVRRFYVKDYKGRNTLYIMKVFAKEKKKETDRQFIRCKSL